MSFWQSYSDEVVAVEFDNVEKMDVPDSTDGRLIEMASALQKCMWQKWLSDKLESDGQYGSLRWTTQMRWRFDLEATRGEPFNFWGMWHVHESRNVNLLYGCTSRCN
ncbi:hypothetical protein V6N12_062213 [Hibiscus sabdariffa]|uniref:Uncharacterized protein n=1 Tax=Hibiscus sabdariffa TaxID=183260 RepID=A0ABR2F868_9ROSI